MIVGNATIVTAMVGYLPVLAPSVFGGVPPLVLALAAIWGLTAVNLAGIRAGGAMQIVTTALKLLPMAAILVLGVVVAIGRPAAYGAHPPTTPIGLAPTGAAMSLALFAMLGLESAAVPAGRVRDPAQDHLPRHAARHGGGGGDLSGGFRHRADADTRKSNSPARRRRSPCSSTGSPVAAAPSSPPSSW